MTITQIINSIAPQLSSHPELNNFINIAMQRTDIGQFKGKYNLAVAYRVAHDMTVAGLDSSGVNKSGMITSEREGDLSRTYGSTASSGISADLGLTSYGLQLQALIKNNIIGVMVVS